MRFRVVDFHSSTPNMVKLLNIDSPTELIWRVLDPIVIAKILEIEENQN